MKDFSPSRFATKIAHVERDGKRYAVRNGKWFEVGTLNPDSAAAKARTPKAKDRSFVQLDYERTLAAAGRLRNAPLAVLIELAYQSFKMHRNTIPLSNVRFQAIGISPDAKVRALRQLELEGLVSVNWRGGRKTPLVTLLQV
jgi:hypothetical protein